MSKPTPGISDSPETPTPPAPLKPHSAPPPLALPFAFSDSKRLKEMNRAALADVLGLQGEVPWPANVPEISPPTANDNSLGPIKQFFSTKMCALEAAPALAGLSPTFAPSRPASP